MIFNFTNNRILILFFYLGVLLLSLCNTYKGPYYLDKADLLDVETLKQAEGVHEARIMPNDILSIVVNSSIKGGAEDFNLPVLPSNPDQALQTKVNLNASSSGTLQTYLVDHLGVINFPVLGSIKLSGMTIQEAQNHITNLIYPTYIASKPIVNIRQLNFEVTVLGEVKNPGLYRDENGQMTILDALAAAGDMTIYGKRDDILLIRTHENGELSFHKINLKDRKIALNKDLFYMQQNDKLYVHANRARGNSSSFGSLESIGLSALSVIISVIAIVTR